MRDTKGITLIALIITIIMLSILAGITIVQLTGSGLFGKARLAEKRTRYANAKETVNFKLMEIQVDCIEKGEEYNIEKIATGMKEAEDITIEKYYNKETGSIKEGVTENLTKLEGIVVSVDEYPEYKFLIGESREIIGVLEGEITNTTSKDNFTDILEFEEEAFKNKTEEITTKKYLYKNGDKCEEITDGWCMASDKNASIDIDSYNYFNLISKYMNYNMAIISTNKPIDITNYTKLKMKATVINNGYTGTTGGNGYSIGLNNPKQIELVVPADPHKYSSGLKQEVGEEVILEQDITNINGEYYIGVAVTAFHLKIYQIWLE